jgi:thimet oligopeptidase
MECTIKGLLAIYEKFFQLRFEQIPATSFWHQDVQLIAAYNALDGVLLGYLLLDFYPRPNKYNHACHVTMVPAIIDEHGKSLPEVSLVIANFLKSTTDKPSLLKGNDVCTFFHEFGHAIHGLLGRTRLASQSGTSVKRDFVEMPSQMLEEWLWDTEVLKMISSTIKQGSHFQTLLLETSKKRKLF